MAEQENTTKAQEEQIGSAEETEGTLSLESLDSIIADEDPEFAAALQNIGPNDGSLSIYEEELELNFSVDDEIRLWKETPGFRSKLVKVLPFLPRFAYSIRMKRTAMRLNMQKWKAQARENIKNLPKAVAAWLKKVLASVKKSVGENLATFKSFSLMKKLSFVGLIVATIATAALIYRMSTQGIFPPDEDLFMGSMTDWSQEKYLYGPEDSQESFYESTRTSQNVLLLGKLVANLRRSQSSGESPMGAFEFYVEGTVSEVVVEIKDREAEVEDLFLRTIEDSTYDQLASGEGKRLLCDRLRKEVNKILTTGFVRRVFIKTVIIKP